MGITKEEYNKMVERAKDLYDGVVWHDMGTLKDGRTLCLVMGYLNGYDKGERYQVEADNTVYTLCQKLAFNIDDLQSSYEMDWYMPWDKKSGDIWDTDMAVDDDSDVDWYNDQAKEIIKELNKGTLEVH